LVNSRFRIYAVNGDLLIVVPLALMLVDSLQRVDSLSSVH